MDKETLFRELVEHQSKLEKRFERRLLRRIERKGIEKVFIEYIKDPTGFRENFYSVEISEED